MRMVVIANFVLEQVVLIWDIVIAESNRDVVIFAIALEVDFIVNDLN